MTQPTMACTPFSTDNDSTAFNNYNQLLLALVYWSTPHNGVNLIPLPQPLSALIRSIGFVGFHSRNWRRQFRKSPRQLSLTAATFTLLIPAPPPLPLAALIAGAQCGAPGGLASCSPRAQTHAQPCAAPQAAGMHSIRIRYRHTIISM